MQDENVEDLGTGGSVPGAWLGRQDSNLRMPVPKTGALPLGDAPAGASAYVREKRGL